MFCFRTKFLTGASSWQLQTARILGFQSQTETSTMCVLIKNSKNCIFSFTRGEDCAIV